MKGLSLVHAGESIRNVLDLAMISVVVHIHPVIGRSKLPPAAGCRGEAGILWRYVILREAHNTSCPRGGAGRRGGVRGQVSRIGLALWQSA